MKPYHNLPAEQRETQRLADQFNADERLWEKLAASRKLRRILKPGLSRKKHQKLDLAEFDAKRHPQSAVGREEIQ
jgi:hypothetical protein